MNFNKAPRYQLPKQYFPQSPYVKSENFFMCLRTAFQDILVVSCHQYSRTKQLSGIFFFLVSRVFSTFTDGDLPTATFLSNNQSSYLCYRLKAPGKLQLVNTMMHRFTIGCTFWDWAFTTTTANTDTVDNVT